MEQAIGSFTVDKNSAKPAELLAKGVGITPFFSIVKQAGHERLRSENPKMAHG
jgi:ferredoxin-NADP reductase